MLCNLRQEEKPQTGRKYLQTKYLLKEYTGKLYKKGLNDLDNRDGVVTHLKPDILEGEVKWTLGSITTNKTSGGDGISAEVFQILKDDAVKMLHSYVSKFGKLISGRRTGKDQFSF